MKKIEKLIANHMYDDFCSLLISERDKDWQKANKENFNNMQVIDNLLREKHRKEFFAFDSTNAALMAAYQREAYFRGFMDALAVKGVGQVQAQAPEIHLTEVSAS